VLVLAYDGSLHGDWVAHYAARFAASSPARRLHLVHVLDGEPSSHLVERLARIDDECRRIGVELSTERVARGRAGVAARLLDRCPRGADTTLVCGTRARGRALLAGTVAEELLAAREVRVVAIRAVHPGVLGQPRRVLLPIAGHPRGAADAIPLLRLLGPDLRHLHVLFVRQASRLRLHDPDRASLDALLAAGRALVARVEEDVRAALAPHRFEVDASVTFAPDAAIEILAAAARHRVRLVCLGASERALPERVLRGEVVERVLRDAIADVAVYRGAR
jgi:nucleotide-binding universal stress UspA family protein